MITSFSDKYRFLSNFYPSKVLLDDVEYPTVEHAFQAAKTDWIYERQSIKDAETPNKAKKLGRKVTLRSNWEDIKEKVMEDLVRQKFANVELRNLLLDTNDSQLIEGNAWGDTNWGCVLKNDEWIGKNLLGKILMKVRKELNEL